VSTSETRPAPYRDTRPATRERLRRAAERAVDDPIKLACAARIVRAALARQALAVSDLTSEAGGPNEAA